MELEACARVVVLFRAGNEGPQSFHNHREVLKVPTIAFTFNNLLSTMVNECAPKHIMQM